jgi:GH43 family beta-xylosidase
MKKIIISFCFFILTSIACLAQQGKATFTNPLLPSGADPWVIYKNGYYYYTNSMGSRLVIWKTKRITNLNNAERKTIWVPPAGMPYSKEIWAPELHFLQGRWYMYFAADDGSNNHHRMYVLENTSPDPMKGEWAFKGQVADITNKWAIDGSVFENKGQLYMIWAGWEGDENGQQNIYIAKMKDPTTVSSERVKISSPQYQWEKYGDLHDDNNPTHVNVNEGPEILKHKNQLFLIYSASGCWTDYYALGMLSTTTNSNLLDPASWKKSAEPVFKQSPENEVYAPGHNSFFRSPNGKEDWILYHANSKPGQGCGKDRSPRAQKFTWNQDGSPNFGIPVKAGVVIAVPKE